MAKREINIELRAAGGGKVAGEIGKVSKAYARIFRLMRMHGSWR